MLLYQMRISLSSIPLSPCMLQCSTVSRSAAASLTSRNQGKCFSSHSDVAPQEVNQLLASVDELSSQQLGDALTTYGVKSPDTKNDISAPFPFNLMFKTSIGPKGDQVGYLRPETAQGLFVNFRSASQLCRLQLPALGAVLHTPLSLAHDWAIPARMNVCLAAQTHSQPQAA